MHAPEDVGNADPFQLPPDPSQASPDPFDFGGEAPPLLVAAKPPTSIASRLSAAGKSFRASVLAKLGRSREAAGESPLAPSITEELAMAQMRSRPSPYVVGAIGAGVVVVLGIVIAASSGTSADALPEAPASLVAGPAPTAPLAVAAEEPDDTADATGEHSLAAAWASDSSMHARPVSDADDGARAQRGRRGGRGMRATRRGGMRAARRGGGMRARRASSMRGSGSMRGRGGMRARRNARR